MQTISRQDYAEGRDHGAIEQPKTWLVVDDSGTVLAEAETEAVADAEMATLAALQKRAKVTGIPAA